jgi:hypothetical protein
MKDYSIALKNNTKKPCKAMLKKGTLDIGIVETTPVIWNKRLYRFEWIRNNQWGGGYWNNRTGKGFFRFTDMETEESTPGFAYDYSFGSAYIEEDTAYVYGVYGNGGGNRLDVFCSKDLKEWENKKVFEFPSDWSLFNTSVCKGNNCYIMAIEIGSPEKICGKPFTIVFASSKNLIDWELMSPEKYVYTKDRYSACPVIRYVDGLYYIIYLEGLPCHRWVPYIVRTSDFIEYELGIKNPVMFFDDNDKIVQRPEKFSNEQLEYINGAVDCNNSDVDLCEFEGKTVILYSWGNQFGKEFLAEAEYDGSMEELLKSFF